MQKSHFWGAFAIVALIIIALVVIYIVNRKEDNVISSGIMDAINKDWQAQDFTGVSVLTTQGNTRNKDVAAAAYGYQTSNWGQN